MAEQTEINQLIDPLFRHASGRMVAVLTSKDREVRGWRLEQMRREKRPNH